MSDPTLGTKSIVAGFDYYPDRSGAFPVKEMYSVDLDGDGTDEIIHAGFETVGGNSGTYSNTNIMVLGWVNGSLFPTVGDWMPNGINQVEGVGDIAFGDFDNDGDIDMFTSAYTDRDHPAKAYQFENVGGSFERTDMGTYTWQHGLASGDINGDGYDDIYAPNWPDTKVFFGSADGLLPGVTTTGGYGGGGDAVLGDFTGDGKLDVITVDAATNHADTSLIEIFANGTTSVRLDKISTLPAPRLNPSHDVRAEAFDFDSDGDLDVMVFSRADWNGSEWPHQSEIQFLENDGSGNFTDVTDSVLIGYDTNSNASYTPIIRDFDGDGDKDIFVSASSYGVDHNSTAFLMNQGDGTFVDTARTVLSSYVSDGGGVATVVKGPDGNFQYITDEMMNGWGGINVLVSAQSLSFPTPVVDTTTTETAESSSNDTTTTTTATTDTTSTDTGSDTSSGDSTTNESTTVTTTTDNGGSTTTTEETTTTTTTTTTTESSGSSTTVETSDTATTTSSTDNSNGTTTNSTASTDTSTTTTVSTAGGAGDNTTSLPGEIPDAQLLENQTLFEIKTNTSSVVITQDVDVSDTPWSAGYYAKNVGAPGTEGPGTMVSIKGYNQLTVTPDGGNGVDAAIGTAGNDAIFLHSDYNPHYSDTSEARVAGIEIIDGGEGNDVIDMTSSVFAYGDIELRGGAGNDHIWASSGDDVLRGGTGVDQLYGGAGNDWFVFETALGERDQIVGFETGTDSVVLDSAIFEQFANDSDVSDNWANGFANQDEDDYLVYENNKLWYDADGVGGADAIAVVSLIGGDAMLSADIMII